MSVVTLLARLLSDLQDEPGIADISVCAPESRLIAFECAKIGRIFLVAIPLTSASLKASHLLMAAAAIL